jgi:hypothetical protein
MYQLSTQIVYVFVSMCVLYVGSLGYVFVFVNCYMWCVCFVCNYLCMLVLFVGMSPSNVFFILDFDCARITQQ